MHDTMKSSIAQMQIHEIMALLDSGEASSAEITDAFLERIRQRNDYIHAYTAIFEESARKQAQEADKARAAGKAGRFCGIPYALKDLVDVSGERTGLGTHTSAAYRATRDAELVKRLRDAGMVLLGKTHTVEFAYGSHGSNEKLGAPRNPLSSDQHFITGGSSSGSAAAVAAGLAPWAVGTDTGGSVRIPSAFCGLTGLRPTLGTIPDAGVGSLSRSLDTIGPLARSVRDVALAYEAMSGIPAPRDILASGRSVALEGRRLAVLADTERKLIHADVLAAYDHSLDVLRTLGAELVPFAFPHALDAFASLTASLIAVEGFPRIAAIVNDPAEPMDESVRQRFSEARELPEGAHERLLEQRRRMRHDFDQALSGFDALLTPTTRGTAVPLSEIGHMNWVPAELTRFVSFLSYAALALPNGTGANNMPTSLQIIGQPQSESILLRIGAALEDALATHDKIR